MTRVSGLTAHLHDLSAREDDAKTGKATYNRPASLDTGTMIVAMAMEKQLVPY